MLLACINKLAIIREVIFATIWWAPQLRQALQPTWRLRVKCIIVYLLVLSSEFVCMPSLIDLLCKELACIKSKVYTSVLMSAASVNERYLLPL